ncbi:MAG: 6-phosphogluconolactonase [Rhodobacteraceae bacterium]|nr:6-phosphogluconolactonase [Paracoccaceae bacterium]
MKFVEYADRDLIMLGLADLLASELAAALRQNDGASFCVPGGTTPGPLFDILSAVRIDWDRVTVFLGDERCVPETDERSNGRLLKSRLLCGRAAEARYLPLYTDAGTTVEDVAAALAPHLPISVLLLGMGADMHTASLFPGADNLAAALAADAPPVMAMVQPATGEARVSLTAPVLAGAMSIHILITGEEKRAAVEKAAHLDPIDAPIAAVLSGATVHWAP